MRKSLWFGLPAAVALVAAFAAPLAEDPAVPLGASLKLDRDAYSPGALVKGTLSVWNKAGVRVDDAAAACSSTASADRALVGSAWTNQLLRGGFRGPVVAIESVRVGLDGTVSDEAVRRGVVVATCVLRTDGRPMLVSASARVARR
ncbi:hypothetical protein [Amycolatopsis sp. NPDC051903]|uniref:hypothetical protein n=1 Tax=Amycolatopsis sp. NPDC051903 TaxID=3363936 RepID=UPI0037B3B54C